MTSKRISNNLLSGKVPKTPSANADPNRHTFLDLNNAEPDLGLPAGNAYILSGNTNGTRYWANAQSSITANTVSNPLQPNITLLGTLSNLAVAGNITTNGITISTSGVFGNALQAQGGIQNTIIGNVAPSSATFTAITIIGGNGSGNLIANGITINNSGTFGTTLSAVGGLQSTPIGDISPSTGVFTALTIIGGNGSGNLIANGLTINNSGTFGTTLYAGGGLQNTVIGSSTPAAGTFTSVTITGAGGSGNLTVGGSEITPPEQ